MSNDDTISVVPGMLLDTMNRIVLTIVSDDSIGVSITRFETFPSMERLQDTVHEETWLTVYRDSPLEIYLMYPPDTDATTEDDEAISSSPQANESAQFALEIALAHWPGWAPGLERKYKPKVPISFPNSMPEA